MKQKKILQKKNNPKPKQKAKFELSAGGIVYNPKLDKVLIIEYEDGRISFPKGHNEKGESMIETAIRETGEETGVKNLQFIAKIGEVTYFFKLNGEFIFKKVVYFLFSTYDINTKPQLSEIKKAYFTTIDEAEKIVTFKNLMPIFKKAEKLIHPVK